MVFSGDEARLSWDSEVYIIFPVLLRDMDVKTEAINVGPHQNRDTGSWYLTAH